MTKHITIPLAPLSTTQRDAVLDLSQEVNTTRIPCDMILRWRRFIPAVKNRLNKIVENVVQNRIFAVFHVWNTNIN